MALRIAAIAALAFALARPAIHRSLSLTWLTIGLLALLGIILLVMASVALAQNRSDQNRSDQRRSNTTSYTLGGASLLAMIVAAIWGTYTAMSGPAMSIDQAQPVAIAIVLDNSPTSAWKTADDDRIARMKDLATWMVARLPRTSRIAIIDRSAQVASFSLDVGSAVSRIEQLRPLEVVQPIASRLEVAARLVRSSDLPQRRVLLISDLTAQTWNDAVSDSTLSTTFQSDPAVALTLFDLGKSSGVNRSLSIPRFDDNSPPRGVPIKLTSTLEVSGNAESEVSTTIELELFDNDPALPVVRDGAVVLPNVRSVDRTSLKVGANGSREILLTIPSLEVGTHHGRIRMVGEDTIFLDDTRYFSLQVLPPSRVLLVGEDEDESQIIGDAISVSDGPPDGTGTAFEVERIGYQDLSVVRLEDFDAMILLDPKRDVMTDQGVLDYVSAGGGVLVCLGPAAGDEAVESTFLPSLVRRWRVPGPGTFLQVLNTSHPVTEPLSENTPWSDFRVHQYWQVEPGESDIVLIRYAGTEHAALIERTMPSSNGQSPGRLLLLTTPIPALAKSTRPWNELFGTDPWPAWLMTRKSVQYLTGRGTTERMSVVGRPLLVQIKEKVLPDQETPSRLQLFRPGAASPTPLNFPADARQVAIDDVSRSGTYWIRGSQVGDGFSANLADGSLNMKRMETEQLDLVFGPDQYGLGHQSRRDRVRRKQRGATSLAAFTGNVAGAGDFSARADSRKSVLPKTCQDAGRGVTVRSRPGATWQDRRRRIGESVAKSQRAYIVSNFCRLTLDHVGNRLAQRVHSTFGHAGDVDPAAADNVDAVLRFQSIDLHLVQTAKREHAVLLEQERKIVAHSGCLHRFDELLTERFDPVTHFIEFGLPQCGQLGIAKDGCDDCGAVLRWIAVVAADECFELTLSCRCFGRICSQQGQRTNTLAVQPKVFRKRTADDHFVTRVDNCLNTSLVFVQAVTKSLIGKVQHRQDSPFSDHRGNLLPLLDGWIDSGWVMATGVQQNRVARSRLSSKVAQHAFEVQRGSIVGQITIRRDG